MRPGSKRQKEFAKARRLMGRELIKDEGLRLGYLANVAVALLDEQSKLFPARIDFENKNCRENVAAEILRVIFIKS